MEGILPETVWKTKFLLVIYINLCFISYSRFVGLLNGTHPD